MAEHEGGSYPDGAGNLPGRQRRRGPLPGSGGSSEGSAPIGSQPLDQTTSSDESGLNVTERPTVPTSKVLGLRVSEQHYNTGSMMLDVLATQFRLDKRQVGELVVQYLVSNRFGLFEYVSNQVGPAPVDLDFFTRKHEDE